MLVPLSPELILQAYTQGIFPMGRAGSDTDVDWIAPHQRGLLPIKNLHIPRRLLTTIRSRILQADAISLACDRAFSQVIKACAARESTWINASIIRAYTQLHRLGFAHSFEVWRGEMLIGGLYGVALGGVFFAESMFSRERDASKIALVYTAACLSHGGFIVWDTQFLTPHLARFGGYEMPQENFVAALPRAIHVETNLPSMAQDQRAIMQAYLQNRTQKNFKG